MKHAPYAIIGDLVIPCGLTMKTACGKRTKTDKLVSRHITDCPDCKAQIQKDRDDMKEMTETAKRLGLLA